MQNPGKSSEWPHQLDRLSRHAMGQAAYVRWVQQMTGCSDIERDRELWRLLDQARLVVSIQMSAGR